MRRDNNGLYIFLTFIFLIATATVAIKSPFVEHSQGISFLDALFTATSATCVTGLTVVPTSGFNLPGQLIILAFIQIGAIGIMTLSVSFILFFQGELNFQKRLMASRLAVSPGLINIEAVLKTVLVFTFCTETIGFFLLAIGFYMEGFSLNESLYYGFFHSISAFCNAGFSCFDTSLEGFNPTIKIVTMALVVLGGIGYYVVFDSYEFFKQKERVTVHTKVVLLATFMCVVLGAVALDLAAQGNITVLDAFFQSVTARTAGFNTINIHDLKELSLLVLVVLMIIGAAPGSTGGGIKITTFWIIIAKVYTILRGRGGLVLFSRRMDQDDIFRAFAVATTYFLFLCAGVVFLLRFEGRELMDTLFVMSSAIGTVGLSLGLASQFGPAGKLVLIVGMFVGRIGPAVLVIMLLREQQASRVEYPTEKIMLG